MRSVGCGSGSLPCHVPSRPSPPLAPELEWQRFPLGWRVRRNVVKIAGFGEKKR